MKEVNIKFPHIVLAQSMIETGSFSSEIFKHNHNLFGMKEPSSRATVAKGTKRGHAYYDHWTQSVVDYALFQSRYMSHLKSESAYLEYLGKHYAEDPNYVTKVKKLIERENLEFKIDQVW
jgi:flagellum-specific peptidoglycan hydrolase FlgJ